MDPDSPARLGKRQSAQTEPRGDTEDESAVACWGTDEGDGNEREWNVDEGRSTVGSRLCILDL